MSDVPRKELAFYYPNPFWYDGNWIKNLVLFFDGVAILVPQYMKNRIDESDPAIVAGLREHDLLKVIEPESAIDKAAAGQLAISLVDIIASGKLEKLAQEGSAFHELSMSRLGFDGDSGLAQMIFEELKARNLATDSKDGVSIPLHPKVRRLVLVLLAQILRSRGLGGGAELNPVTDMARIVESLEEFLSIDVFASEGGVVSFDMNIVGVDVSSFPLDEVLGFRLENYQKLKKYRDDIRIFAAELSALPAPAREALLRRRQEELDALASEIRRASTKAWRKPAAFAFSLMGAAWNVLTHNPVGAVLSVASAGLGYTPTSKPDLGAYSYVFRASDRFRY
jgi:hypothetical protein